MIEVAAPVTPAEIKRAKDSAIAACEKEFGKGIVFGMKDRVGQPVPNIPTGIYEVDYDVLGVGGVPKGRIIEIYGPESCLDSSTFIQYEVRTPSGRANHKGGSIKRLYERFHGLTPSGDGRGKYQRPSTDEAEFYAPCMNEDGGIFQNKITDVVSTGEKECWLLETEDGQSILATQEHKFFSGGKFVPLSDLEVGDVVSVHNCTPYSVDEYEPAPNRKYVFVKAHGVAGTKWMGKYEYKRLLKSRAIVEAGMNGLPYDRYIAQLNSGCLSGLLFLDRDDHVHHKDEDALNDAPENLVVITATDHGRLHATERHNNLRYKVIDTRIVFKELIGVRETYDLRMEAPFNNYVAEGFVVHNSGKTTLALLIVAAAQREGGLAAFVDVEHALSPDWATKNGCNMQDLLVSQPDYGEQALQVVEKLVESGAFPVVVVDSVAALIPRAELDGEIGDAHVGLQARLMSQACRKLTGIVSKTNTVLVFINQIREKIGVTWGSPETTAGGRALKFYASVRLDVRRVGQYKIGDTIVGNKTKIKAAKNKVAAPFRETEINLLFDQGFDCDGSLVDAAIRAKVVEKSGSWFSYKGERIGQGRENAIESLRSAGLLGKILTELRAEAAKEAE